MKIVCKKCGQMFESVIVDRQKAFIELETVSTKHVARIHPQEFAETSIAVTNAVTCVSRLIHFDDNIIVPDDEEFIQEVLDENEETVMLAAGFEPQEDEDEDDGEETVEIINPVPEEGEEEEGESNRGNVLEMVKTEEENS